ncbi:hypothetical protein GGI07_002268 [Coemansia sp. Benny D115]|nr:hypothetical protein GGI07_002268 [Coemansia sp. Benny D115]
MTATSFRNILETLPQQAVKQALYNAFVAEDRADAERIAGALEQLGDTESKISDSQRGGNYDLNRYSNVVPFNANRVHLSGKSDYINASRISLPKITANQYIATQGPLNHSIGDFWRMVWEQGAKAVVMLANPKESLRTKCAVYWPEKTASSMRLGDVTVTLIDERPMQDCLSVIVRKLELMHSAHPGELRVVTQMHYTEWPDHGVPQSPLPILRIAHELRSTVSPTPEAPVVVHCSAGVGRTGTFIVIDAARSYFGQNDDYPGDLVLDAFTALRAQRTLMVQTFAQFMMCYQVAGFIVNEKR